MLANTAAWADQDRAQDRYQRDADRRGHYERRPDEGHRDGFPPGLIAPLMQLLAPLAAPPQPVRYLCDNPRGAYPQVTACHGPWRQVVAPPR